MRMLLTAIAVAGIVLNPGSAQNFSLALRLDSRPLLEAGELTLQGSYYLELLPGLEAGLRAHAGLGLTAAPGGGGRGKGKGRGKPEDGSSLPGFGLSPYLEYAAPLLDGPALNLEGYAGARADLSLSPPGYALGFNLAPYAGLDLGYALADGWELLAGLEARLYLLPAEAYLSSYLEADFYGLDPLTLYAGYSLYLGAVLAGGSYLGHGPYLGAFYPVLEGLSLQGEAGGDGAWYAFVRLRVRF
ncbi:hypothetical protein Mterra_00308 [Calidithermus terrae]|uniref:MetA-pathway of phenol degradation n=1 Tax=Calidithermus terrae TaxID=1408545 RepID=A0A399F331_9DEIN|nr:hypothetical protein [Calidithermus terrae]RIH90608.1 hypothetical protein Mterra_00308 [Calidithermus terrae]